MTFFIFWSSCLKGGYLYTGERRDFTLLPFDGSLITLQLVHLSHWWLFLKRWLVFVVSFEKFGVDAVAQNWTGAFCSVHIVESGVLDVVCPSASCPQKCLICKAWKTIWGKQGTSYILRTITQKWAYGVAALLMNGRFNRGGMFLFQGVVAVCMPEATPLLVFDDTCEACYNYVWHQHPCIKFSWLVDYVKECVHQAPYAFHCPTHAYVPHICLQNICCPRSVSFVILFFTSSFRELLSLS